MKSIRSSSQAFVLVEIVIALGVVAVALAAIFGLLSVALDSSKRSADDTALVSMANDVLSAYRSQSFDQIDGTDPVSGTPPEVVNTFYYDASGSRLDAVGNPLTAANAFYTCNATLKGDAATLGAADVSGNRPINLLRVKLTFDWRGASAASDVKNRTIYASIARY